MNPILKLALALGCALLPLSFAQDAELGTKPVLTLEVAKMMSVAAEAEAELEGWTVAIAIVDDGGHLVHFVKRDGTQYASTEVAQLKARTAIGFKRPSGAFEEAIGGGRTAVLSLDVLALQGGLPIEVDGEIIGAIGVSGVQSAQDTQVAQAALDALAEMLGQ